MKQRKTVPAVNPISWFGEKSKNPQKLMVSPKRQILWLLETASFVGTVPMSRAIPKMRAILAMFEPIIFPRMSPGESLFRADIEVNNSGVEVAMDTMVSPTTTGGMPSWNARFALWSLNQSPPLIKR